MVSPDVVDIGSEYFAVYLSRVVYTPSICSAGYAELPVVLLYQLHSMLGVSHAVQNEKKLWKFTQSDR